MDRCFTSIRINAMRVIAKSDSFGGFVRFLSRTVGCQVAALAVSAAVLFLAGCSSTPQVSATSGLPAPVIAPLGGAYSTAQTVLISDSNFGAIIYCTVDGSTPTTASNQCNQPLVVAKTETIKAIAVIPGGAASPVASQSYTINLPTGAAPTFSETGGTYTSAQTVYLYAATGASIYYTTDGTDPSSSSNLYTSSGIQVSTSETIKAISVLFQYGNSTVASETFTINLPAATPSFSPAGGSYSAGQTVTISDTTPNATIYYTVDGTRPTTSSPVYANNPISVAYSQTLQAVAIAPNSSLSAVANATYTLNLTATATPTFSVAGTASTGGIFTNPTPVTISDSTPGAVIYYTTTGTTPTINSTIYTGPVTVASTATINAMAMAPGDNPSSAASATFTINPPAAVPTFIPPGGNYNSVQTLEINDATPGATIYYTTNGSQPTTSNGTIYGGPIVVPVTETVKAIAARSGYTTSTVGMASYNLTLPPAATPVISPASGGPYTTIQSVTIHDGTVGSQIFYTTDGSQPSNSSPTAMQYGGPISVSQSETVSAIAYATGYSPSSVQSVPYTINLPALAQPVISPTPSGTYTSANGGPTVSISVPSGALAYYTIDGTTPSATTGTLYAAPFTLTSTATVKAVAVETGYNNSPIASEDYTVNLTTVAMPVISLASGNYVGAQTVNITDATSGAKIYYSIENSAVNASNGTLYTGTITIPVSNSSVQQLYAIAVDTNYNNSSVAHAYYYTYPDATPVITPAGGAASGSTSITISDASTTDSIIYTINNGQPSYYGALYYGTATQCTANPCTFKVTPPATVQAAMFSSNSAQNSAVAINTYTTGAAAAAPTLTPNASGNPFSTAPSVNMNSTTTGATIFYTTDGSTPTFYLEGTAPNLTVYPLNGQPYNSPVTVGVSETINAVAWAYGSSTSTMTTVNYDVTAPEPSPTFSNQSGTYSSNQSGGANYVLGFTDIDANAQIYYTTDGSTPSTTNGTLYSSSVAPILPLGMTVVNAVAVGTGGTSSVATATYNIVLPTEPMATLTPPAGIYTSPQTVFIISTDQNALYIYTTDGSTPSESNGNVNGTTQYATQQSCTDSGCGYTINVPSSEVLNVVTTACYSFGYCYSSNADSPEVSASYAINLPPLPAPTFLPTPGTYLGAQTVTIADATPGSVIYYTLDGSVPSATNGTQYTAPFTISTTATLNAIATSSTGPSSVVTAGLYTITTGANSFNGSVFSGSSAVNAASVQVYAAGTTGYGSTGTALLTNPVITDLNGNFSMNFNCPASPGDQLYLVATGGDAGAGANSGIALMAALGKCVNINQTVPVTVNEAATVAAAYALSGFMTTAPNVGASATNYTGLANAFLTADNLVNASGQALSITPYYGALGATPGGILNASYVPQARINSLANTLNSCAGGSPSQCSSLFAAATLQGGAAPANTLQAMLNIAHNPGMNVADLYALGTTIFTPTLTAAPNDWTLALTFTGGGLGNDPSQDPGDGTSVAALAIDGAGNIWLPTAPQVYGASGSVVEFNNQGVPLSPALSQANSYTGGGYPIPAGSSYNPPTGTSVAIDTAGNAWIGTSSSIIEMSGNGTDLQNVNFGVSQLAFDYSGNLWGTQESCCFNMGEYIPSTSTLIQYEVLDQSGFNGSFVTPSAITFDAYGFLWAVNDGYASNGDSDPALAELLPFNVAGFDPNNPYATYAPYRGYSEGAGFGVVADSHGNVFSVGSGGTTGTITQQSLTTPATTWNSYPYPLATGVSYSYPLTGGTTASSITSLAIDGSANLWGAVFNLIPSEGESGLNSRTVTSIPTYLVELSNGGSLLSPYVSGSVYGYTGTGGGGEAQPILSNACNGSAGLAVDGSGNVWAANPCVASNSTTALPGEQLVEFVGLGTPVVTPTSVALKNNVLATKP
jgi:hypothetical protein